MIKKSGFRRKTGILRTVLAVFVSSLLLNSAALAAHRMMLQRGIAEEVVRFHILANSDSSKDQQVKLQVRDAVLAWMEGQEQSFSDREAAKQYLVSHCREIEAVADDTLKRLGLTYRSEAEVVAAYFPERTYQDLTFPAGWYDAVRIRLGKAEGHNWWCVLYPNLCFSDCLRGVAEDGGEEDLKKVLTAEEYESLQQQPDQWKITFKWFH